MKTIQDIKDEVAKKYNQKSWKDFIWNHFSGDLTPRAIDKFYDQVCELYASQFKQSKQTSNKKWTDADMREMYMYGRNDISVNWEKNCKEAIEFIKKNGCVKK